MFETVEDTITTLKIKLLQIWHSRTMRFSMFLMVAGCIQTSIPEFQKLFSPTVYGLIVMIIGMAVGFLRIITTMPLSDK